MKRQFASTMAMVFLMATASFLPALASNMDHPKNEGMKHENMHESMAMLGEKTVDGVKAMAHLQDVSEKMIKMGMSETHHFMVVFTDASTGELLGGGAAAVKVKSPSGKQSSPLKLMGMQGHFGADVTLSEKGEYEFIIGTKLEDGKKRQYQFTYDLK